jgi:ElaB/YqjD/DUF883 family membrane-anchored ribosome-binding protein
MDQSTYEVQQDRERTRSAITEKIDLLEETVRDRVEGAKTRVKQSFDIRYHVDQRPWQMLGLSVVAGYLIGRMAANRTADVDTRAYAPKYWRPQPASGSSQQTGFDAAASASPAAAEVPSIVTRPRQRTSWAILDQFQGEIAALKGAAVAAVVSVIRDLLKSATDSFKDSSQSRAGRSTDPRQAGIH